MATATNGVRTDPLASAPTPEYWTGAPSDTGAGWVVFAGIMFMVSSMLNVIWGIAALSNSHFFVGNATYILSDLNTWGWVAIGFGALEALAGLSIWRGGAFGRWFGIGVASLAILAAMMSIPAYPFWALVLVAIDVLVIYGLAAYGGRPELTR
jgi:hypothetical protein